MFFQGGCGERIEGGWANGNLPLNLVGTGRMFQFFVLSFQVKRKYPIVCLTTVQKKLEKRIWKGSGNHVGESGM